MKKIKNVRESNFSQEKKKMIVGSTIVVGFAIIAGLLVGKLANADEKGNTQISNSIEISETNNTLETYNNWLEYIGLDERLTETDLEIIEANTTNGNIISLKFPQNDNQYCQVKEDDLLLENLKGKLEFMIPEYIGIYDLLTGKGRTGINDKVLDSFGNYIIENDIQPIGFVPQTTPNWYDVDVEFIKANYSENILNCLEENGFPLPCYDVEDIYKVYEDSKSATLGLHINE